MPDIVNPLERRSHLLAERLKEYKRAFSEIIAPPGQPPAFSTRLSKSEALVWWREHYNDDLGAKALKRMSPLEILELTQELSRANEEMMFGGIDDGLRR